MINFKRWTTKATVFVGIMTTCGGGLAWCISQAEAVKNAYTMFQSPDARVMMSADTAPMNVGETKDLVISVYPTAQPKMPRATITITTSSKALQVIPEADAEVAEFSGSALLKQFKVRAVSYADTPINVSATYRTGELERTSNVVTFMMAPKQAVPRPHFERTDTKRVNLTGEWEMTLGASPGALKLTQAESKLTGSFALPRYKWHSGKVSGSKDGNTFRMQFSIPSKSVEERLWVVGDYEIDKGTGSIQMRGCAYHLRNAPDQKTEAGAQGVDCSIAVKFSNWKTLQGDTFSATASFDFGSDY